MNDPLAAMKAAANLRSLEERGLDALEPAEPPAPAERVRLPNERVEGVRVVHVVRVLLLRGSGRPGDPVRPVDQFYDFEGKLLAERDTLDEMQEAAG